MRDEWILREETIVSIAWDFQFHEYSISMDTLESELEQCNNLLQVQKCEFFRILNNCHNMHFLSLPCLQTLFGQC